MKSLKLLPLFIFLLFTNGCGRDSVSYSGGGLTFPQLIQAGGLVMGIIILLSIGMLALGIISFIWLKREKFISDEARNRILGHIGKGQFNQAYVACEESSDTFSKILESGLKNVNLFTKKGKKSKPESIEIFYLMEHIKKMMEVSGAREAEKIRSVIHWFSNIGVLSPMLGLLGTVLGMIRAFGAIAFKVETGKPVLLSSAISQAMVTTAGGLIVGIMCMLLFYYFSSRADKIINELEASVEEVAEETEQAFREN